jgi:hypothetical protein
MKKTLLALLLFTGIPHLLGQEILLRWSFDDLKDAQIGRPGEELAAAADPAIEFGQSLL